MVLDSIPVVTGQEPGQTPSTSVSSPPNVHGPKEKTYSDLSCSHIMAGNQTQNLPALTTVPFLQAALEKYLNYSKVFPQKRIVKHILWC